MDAHAIHEVLNRCRLVTALPEDRDGLVEHLRAIELPGSGHDSRFRASPIVAILEQTVKNYDSRARKRICTSPATTPKWRKNKNQSSAVRKVFEAGAMKTVTVTELSPLVQVEKDKTLRQAVKTRHFWQLLVISLSNLFGTYWVSSTPGRSTARSST